jgi:hypothetical protein
MADLHAILECKHKWSEMTLNYQVIVEKYPFSNRVPGGSISTIISSLYLMMEKKPKKPSEVGRKPRAHLPQGDS